MYTKIDILLLDLIILHHSYFSTSTWLLARLATCCTIATAIFVPAHVPWKLLAALLRHSLFGPALDELTANPAAPYRFNCKPHVLDLC